MVTDGDKPVHVDSQSKKSKKNNKKDKSKEACCPVVVGGNVELASVPPKETDQAAPQPEENAKVSQTKKKQKKNKNKPAEALKNRQEKAKSEEPNEPVKEKKTAITEMGLTTDQKVDFHQNYFVNVVQLFRWTWLINFIISCI